MLPGLPDPCNNQSLVGTGLSLYTGPRQLGVKIKMFTQGGVLTWRASRRAAPRKKQIEPPPKPTPVIMLY